MRFTRFSLFIAGAVTILILGVPRAAHAVAATLVQVANTASTPVIAQGIGNQAAQIMQIECGYGPDTIAPNTCFAMPASGIPAYPPPYSYVVPEGQTLVVTAVDILSGASAGSPCNSSALVGVMLNVPPGATEGVTRKFWIVPAGTGTAHYVYPSGILFAPGTSIVYVRNFTTTCTLTLDMHGYLTAQ
jgi:hypothetical protein